MFSVGDFAFVPNACEWRWKTSLTVIKKIEETENGKIYYADCLHNNLFARDEGIKSIERTFAEREVFKTKEECDEYVGNYYYDRLCRGCKYDKVAGNVWRCDDCEYAVTHFPENPTDSYCKKCSKSGITISGQYSRGFEICKFYKPILPQNIREYVSWEKYNDILMNCEFNPQCRHHTDSAHRTCTYDWYMQQHVRIPLVFEYDGRKVKQVGIHRRNWIDQDFMENGIVKCTFLILDPELTKTGRKKKNSINSISFEKTVSIDVEKGVVISD